MTAARGSIIRRSWPSLALLALMVVCAVLWVGGAQDAYFALSRLLGVPAYRFPFLDTHGVLAVIDCQRRGLDTYVTNPCDVMGRVHVYTPLWFRFADLPVTAAATPIVGALLALVFTASLLLLPGGRNVRAAWLFGAAACSPAVLFAIERGNADLLIFVLAALAGWMVVRRGPARLLAYPVVLLAAGLKLYPATLLILALRERLALCLAIAALSVALLVGYALIDAGGLHEMLAVVPAGTPFIYSFGARNLPTGLGMAFGWSPLVLAGVDLALVLAAASFALARLPRLQPAARALTPAEATSLLIGAILILGCFVTGQSGEYRAVHLLFVLPALAALAGAGQVRGLAGCTAGVVVAQLWGDVVSAHLDLSFSAMGGDGIASWVAFAVWFTRELAWWWIAAVLAALMLAVIANLPSIAALRGWGGIAALRRPSGIAALRRGEGRSAMNEAAPPRCGVREASPHRGAREALPRRGGKAEADDAALQRPGAAADGARHKLEVLPRRADPPASRPGGSGGRGGDRWQHPPICISPRCATGQRSSPTPFRRRKSADPGARGRRHAGRAWRVRALRCDPLHRRAGAHRRRYVGAAPGGDASRTRRRLIVLAPAHPYLFSRMDAAIGHHRRYTMAGLRALTPAGCRLAVLCQADAAGWFASLANRLVLHRAQPTAGQIAVWDGVLVPISRRLDRLLRFRFGKSILAVWRRADDEPD